MTMKIAPHIQQELLDALFERSPLSSQDGKAYLAYDCITVEQQKGGYVRVGFSWRGKKVAWLDIEADFTKGECVSVTGIEGRQQISLTD